MANEKGSIMLDVAGDLLKTINKNSYEVDKSKSFPLENLRLLKDSGLMNMFIPQLFGGLGGSVTDLLRTAKVLGGACLSTGMIWAMHCQQIACLVNHSNVQIFGEFISDICTNNYYLGSVTSEAGNNGHLLAVNSPLIHQENHIILDRFAPIVTGGQNCDGYLITMRTDSSSPANDIKLVYAKKHQLRITPAGEWNTLGMRGTNSIALHIEGKVPVSQIVNEAAGFSEIAYQTMIPIGHLLWASSWLGAAAQAYKQSIKIIKGSGQGNSKKRNSEIILERIARVRMSIDIVQTYLHELTRYYEESFSTNRNVLSSTKFLIRINNLKVYASEQMFSVVDELMDIVGMRFGYLQNEYCQLERTFRDLRSASMMIANQNLMTANGKLALFEKEIIQD